MVEHQKVSSSVARAGH